MRSNKPGSRVINYATAVAALVLCADVSHADQGGSSFWFPGQFASLAAMQQTPGWALSVIDYHSSAAARRERCCGQRDPGRPNPRERQR